MEFKLEPADEYMHPGPEETFNESMYFNTFDPLSKVGVFLRIGNRPNEGHAEVTTCIYLPDGRVAFMFSRPEIDNNDGFNAGGARFEVDTPFEALRIAYKGKVVLLDNPGEMAEPREAFTNNPYARCELELAVSGNSAPWGGEPVGVTERPGEEFAKGHYEQLTRSSGTLKVGDESFEINGQGLRDHSWGPRTWQAPWYYRWLTVNMGDGTGMMITRIARQDSDGIRHGFVWNGSEILPVTNVTMDTDWDGDSYQKSLRANFTFRDSDGSKVERTLTGSVRNMIPLRNRREGMVTRIAEGLTDWSLSAPLATNGTATNGAATQGDALSGHGWSEYLDQIIDDQPVGIDE